MASSRFFIVCTIILAGTLLLVFIWLRKSGAQEQEAAASAKGKK